jgi:Uncharacterized conserved protein (DUF2358)
VRSHFTLALGVNRCSDRRSIFDRRWLAVMDIIEILKADYARFPIDQSFEIYAKDMYFQDPLNRFHGVNRYRLTIGFMKTFFKQIQFDLHSIDRIDRLINTRWTLQWNTPVPWYPRIEITGRSELLLAADRDLIISHIDYWDCSPWDVVKQHFRL